MLTIYIPATSDSQIKQVLEIVLLRSGKIKNLQEVKFITIPTYVAMADSTTRSNYLIQQRISAIKNILPTDKILFLGRQYCDSIDHYTKALNKINVEQNGGMWCITHTIFTYLNPVSTSYQIQTMFEGINNLNLGRTKYLIKDVNYKIKIVDSEENLKEFERELWACKTPSIDVETEASSDTLITIQIATDKNTAWIIPTSYYIAPSLYEKSLSILKHFYEESKNEYHIYQNGMFDMKQQFEACKLRWYEAPIYDLMGAEFQLSFGTRYTSDVYSPYSLGTICTQYGYEYTGIIGKEERLRMTNFDFKDICEYGAQDVIIPLHIVDIQKQKAIDYGIKDFVYVVSEVIGNIVKATAIQSYNGIPVDTDYSINILDSYQSTVLARVKEIQEWFNNDPSCKKAISIWKNSMEKPDIVNTMSLLGIDDSSIEVPFDLSNNALLDILFFVVLGLEGDKSDKSDTFKKDDEFKEKYKDTVKAVKLYSEYKEITQGLSTFILGVIKKTKMKKKNGLISNSIKNNSFTSCNSEYSFTNVITGRISSRDPNLQNIPAHNSITDLVRKQFKAMETFETEETKVYGSIENLDKVLK